MEMSLPKPKAVLANEAFPKGAPRPDFLDAVDKPRPSFFTFMPVDLKKWGKSKHLMPH